MTKINCQKGQPINSLNPFLILIPLLFVILISRSEVGAADASPCAALLHPLESKVEGSKARVVFGGCLIKTIKCAITPP